MAYGIPYCGSKSRIADRLLELMPAGGTFFDLFAGGCAMTHAAMLTGKWSRVLANDKHPDALRLFADAIAGKTLRRTEWVSHDAFRRLRDSDPFVRYVWSFGGKGERYLYGRNVVPWKMALLDLYAHGNDAAIRAIFPDFPAGLTSDEARAWIKAHGDQLRQAYAGRYGCDLPAEPYRLQHYESAKRINALSALGRPPDVSMTDYASVPITGPGVIYCDPPYLGTENPYGEAFDYERFYSWAESQSLPVFVSEYWMPPDRFRCVAEFKLNCTLSFVVNGDRRTERLFVPVHQKHQADALTLF